MKKKATPAKAAAPAPAETVPAAAKPAAKRVPIKMSLRDAKKLAKKKAEKKEPKPPAPPPTPQKWKRGDPTSSIVINAREKVNVNPRNPAMAASLAVIHQLAKRAFALPDAEKAIVVKFLIKAYEDVKKGGGSNGSAAADPFPPPEPGS
jgi:hypothetical protein